MDQIDRSTTSSEVEPNSVISDLRHRIALPEPSQSYDQDAEWCVVELDSGWHEIRFHDYGEIFDQPGLYEQLFYDLLECDSPRFMCEFLRTELKKAGAEPTALRVLDLGAGNGIMGEELSKLGVHFVVGADILPAAARAADRDRPGTYRDYHVLDLTALSPAQLTMLRDYEFNALTCIAALGFGDIPPACFRAAFNLLSRDSWVALNIKKGFLAETDTSGFSRLLRDAIRNDVLEVIESRVYRHRLATNRTPLYYTGIICRKRGDL